MSYFRGSQRVAFFHPTPLNGASLLTGASCKPTPLAFFPVEKEMLFQFLSVLELQFHGLWSQSQETHELLWEVGLICINGNWRERLKGRSVGKKSVILGGLTSRDFPWCVCVCVLYPSPPMFQHFAFVRFNAERPQMLFCKDEIFKKFLLKVSTVVEMQLLLDIVDGTKLQSKHPVPYTFKSTLTK